MKYTIIKFFIKSYVVLSFKKMRITNLFKSKLIDKHRNGAPYYTGFKSLSLTVPTKSNFVFEKWWRDGLYRSDRFVFDTNSFEWAEFPSYKYEKKSITFLR